MKTTETASLPRELKPQSEIAGFTKKEVNTSLNEAEIKRFRLFESGEKLQRDGDNGNYTGVMRVKEESDDVKLYFQRKLSLPNEYMRLRNSFTSLQKWEGVVEEMLDDSFRAKLKNLTVGGTDEEVTFSIHDDISIDDRELVKEGAIFYWNVGYQYINNQIFKTSLIRFRRLPEWSAQQIDKALDQGNEFKNAINWD